MDRLLALQILRAGNTLLSLRDWEFASSMLNQYDRRGRLSDKQWVWIERLAKRVQREVDVTVPIPIPTKEVPVQEPAPEIKIVRPRRKIILES